MGKIVGAFLGFLLIVGLVVTPFLVTRVSTNPDQVALHYKAGPFSATDFEDCVKPSTREWHGPGDKHFYYPSGQRTYSFGVQNADAAATEGQHVVALTKDNQELTTTGFITFTLDTDCEILEKFHEEIGNRSKAYMIDGETSDGWRGVLDTYMRQQLQRAVNDATQKVNWKELYNNPEVKEAWEQEVRTTLPRYIRQAMGADYFTDFSVTIQKPDLPDGLKTALQATEIAKEENNAQAERNATIQTELESIEELVRVLGPEGYNTYQAIKDGRIPVYPIPQGSSVVVDPNLHGPGSTATDPAAEQTQGQ